MSKCKLIRDIEKYKMQLIDENENILLEMGFIADEFIITFFKTNPVIISKLDDEILYIYLEYIMANEYVFLNKFSTKKDNEIIWFSDQYCDLDNPNETDKVNRLIIRKEENKFILSYYNPFFEKTGIKKSQAIIVFSPSGNGSLSKNSITGKSFQDDLVLAFHSILNKDNDMVVKLVKDMKGNINK